MGLGNIFAGKSVRDFFDDERRRLREEIEKLEVNPAIESDQKARLFETFYVVPLEVIHEEIMLDGTFHPLVAGPNGRGSQEDKNQIHARVDIPFRGLHKLFEFSPDSRDIVTIDPHQVFPEDRLHGVIKTTIRLNHFDPARFKFALENFINELTRNFPAMNRNVSLWNDSLQSEIDSIFDAKKLKIEQKQAFMDAIGLKINRAADKHLSPLETKQVIIFDSKIIDVGLRKIEIPTVPSKYYEDILQLLHTAGISMERKPSLYQGKGENALRDVFLLFLETRYEKTSGHGEAFNQKGRTDILLRHTVDNSNVFVAECKIWSGQSELHKAIDQLLSYLTHRDTQAALMVFVTEPAFTPILEKANDVMRQHPNFLKEHKETARGSYAYEFSLKGDPGAHIRLQLLLFSFNQ